jgi:regulator of nucleoside diphosphate kinase
MRPLTHDIVLTQFDHRRLKGMVNLFRTRSSVDPCSLDALELELERAQTVPPHAVPSDVVTMNSKVILCDLATGARGRVTLVFPDARAPHGQRVPVLSPLGLALLGCRVGHVLEFFSLGGPRKLCIEAVEYQPEAAGNFLM